MHYYKRNIGDYAKKAARLTMLQHGAYTLLMDACYDREQFPTLQEAIDWCWASSKEEMEAVEFVLRKFFVEKDGKFTQSRVQEEVSKYHKNAKTNKRIAIERETKRRENSTKRAQTVNEASPVDNEPPPNHKPLTTNQEPVTNKKTGRFTPPTLQEVSDYCRQRNNSVDPNRFMDHYTSNGWMRGKTKIKDWKACVRTWEQNQTSQPQDHQRPDLLQIARNQ